MTSDSEVLCWVTDGPIFREIKIALVPGIRLFSFSAVPASKESIVHNQDYGYDQHNNYSDKNAFFHDRTPAHTSEDCSRIAREAAHFVHFVTRVDQLRPL